MKNGDSLTGTGTIFPPAPLFAGLAAAAEKEAEEDGEHHQSYGSTHSNEDSLPQREHRAISICRETLYVCMYFKRKKPLQASKVSISDYLLRLTRSQLYKCRAGNAGATIKVLMLGSSAIFDKLRNFLQFPPSSYTSYVMLYCHLPTNQLRKTLVSQSPVQRGSWQRH